MGNTNTKEQENIVKIDSFLNRTQIVGPISPKGEKAV